MIQNQGFNLSDIKAMIKRSVKYTFLSKEEQEDLIKKLGY
jgi:hypothetical protein